MRGVPFAAVLDCGMVQVVIVGEVRGGWVAPLVSCHNFSPRYIGPSLPEVIWWLSNVVA